MRTHRRLALLAGIFPVLLATGCGDKSKPTEPSFPAAPTELTCVLNGGSAVLLTWRDNAADETGFRVERSAGGGGQFTAILTLPPNSETYADTGLVPGRYDYRVIAFNASGDSPPSNTASIEVQEPVPAAPAQFRIAQRGFFSFMLAWDDVSGDETGFLLERSKEDSLHFQQAADLAANTASFTDSLLDPGTTYYYRIRGYNRAGWSEYAGTLSGTTRVPLLRLDPSSVNAAAGDRISFSLGLADPLTGFFGVSMRIRFDENTLRFISFNAAGLFSSDAIVFSELRGNTVYATLTLKQGASQADRSGELAAIVFEAVGSGNGWISIQDENVQFYDASGNMVQMPYLLTQDALVTVM
jgi:hypothetical protein